MSPTRQYEGVTNARSDPRLVLIAIEVNDVHRSARLYDEAFGIRLHVDDHEGGLDDLAAADERARYGAEVVHDARSKPWGRTSRYRDYDGDTISLTAEPLLTADGGLHHQAATGGTAIA